MDFSLLPPIFRKGWAGAVRVIFHRPIKLQLTVRIDAEVLVWLKSYGKGYQGRLNPIFRAAMLRRRKPKRSPKSGRY